MENHESDRGWSRGDHQLASYIPSVPTRCQVVAQNIAAVLLLLGSIAVIVYVLVG